MGWGLPGSSLRDITMSVLGESPYALPSITLTHLSRLCPWWHCHPFGDPRCLTWRRRKRVCIPLGAASHLHPVGCRSAAPPPEVRPCISFFHRQWLIDSLFLVLCLFQAWVPAWGLNRLCMEQDLAMDVAIEVEVGGAVDYKPPPGAGLSARRACCSLF